MNKDILTRIIEALIFASDTPLSVEQMSAMIENVSHEEVQEALQHLAADLNGRAFFLKKVGGGYQFASKPEYARWIKKMYAAKAYSRLTRAALETLAIIAFKQPVSKVEVSAIRGVNSDGVIKGLLERKLITISGRDHGPGRALMFSTTKEFLLYFGINDIADLPKPKEVEELLAAGEGERLIKELPEEKLLAEPAAAGNASAVPPVDGVDGRLAEPVVAEEDQSLASAAQEHVENDANQ